MSGGGPATALRVALADDSALVRSGVRSLLAQAGMDVVAEAADGEQLLAAVSSQPVELVVTDVRMPPDHQLEGVRAALEVQRRFPQTAIVLLSNHVEVRHIATLLERSRAGVGYLLKERVIDDDQFVGAVRRVADGATVLDPTLVASLLRHRRHRNRLATLSPREHDVLAEMAAGASNLAIAAALGTSVKTVETHVQHLFEKLDLVEDPVQNRRVKAVLTFLESG